MFRPSKTQFIWGKTNKKKEKKKPLNIFSVMQRRQALLNTAELSNGACLDARKRPFGSKKMCLCERVGNCTPVRVALHPACECKLQ